MEAIQYVELSKLALRPQVRDCAEDETIAGLAASIQAVGLQQPLRVRREGEQLIVLDGERRLRAVHLLGGKTVAIIVEDRELSPADVRIRQTVCNVQRKGLSPLEFARAMKEFIGESGLSVGEAAAMCGFSPASVSRHLKLLDAPAEVQAKVESGELLPSIAYEIAKVADPAKQIELAKAAVNGKLTRDAVKRQAKGVKRSGKPAKRCKVPSITIALGAGRSITARGPDLTCIATLIAWLTEAVESLKAALADGCELPSLREYFKERRRIRPA
jgi:ParB family transcriptional regulator, chromosome partitioning protein